MLSNCRCLNIETSVCSLTYEALYYMKTDDKIIDKIKKIMSENERLV